MRWMRQGDQDSLKRAARQMLPLSVVVVLASIIAVEVAHQPRWLYSIALLPVLPTIVAALSPTLLRVLAFLVIVAMALFAIFIAAEEVLHVGWLFVLASLLVLLLIVAAVSVAFRRSREQPHSR